MAAEAVIDQKKIKQEHVSFLPEIVDIDWRIERKICDNISDNLSDETTVLAQFTYREEGELKQKTFEFTYEGIDCLRKTLDAICKKLSK